MNHKTFLAVGLVLSGASTLLADFQYQQTTKITGGMLAGMVKIAGAFSKQVREPITSTTYVKGNRMAHISPHHGEVIDLDKETITSIDFDKKQYSTMTFEQMKQAMQAAVEQAQQQKPEQQKAEQKADAAQNAELKFKASVKDTGNSKQVNGVDTKEFIMNLMMEGTDKKTGESGTFGMTNDMWMAPEIAGYQEVRDFDIRMAQKLGMILGEGFNPMQLARPDMMKGMSELAKEMAKLKGVPVMQVTRMGTAADGQTIPAASEAPEAAQGPSLKEAAGRAAVDSAANTAGNAAENRLGRLGGIAGGLGGGLGGFGRSRKKQQDEQAAQQKQAAEARAAEAPQGAAILMEMTTEMSGFSSSPVDGSRFDAPAGFKQVEPEMGRKGRR
jgi:hypothetical protein